MSQSTPKNLPVPTHFSQTQLLLGAMQVITASDELFNHVDDNLYMWSGEGDRSVSVNIVFVRDFNEPPAITLGLSGMDSDHAHNQRFWLNAINIKSTGFTIELTTWGTTHIARAGVSWQAIGEAKNTAS